MPLTFITVPCLQDNYAYLLHNPQTGETALIDAPEAAPIQAELDARGWALTQIALTHHHPDHVDGVAALRGAARVIGAAADAHRLPDLDLAIAPGDQISLCGAPAHVLDVSGHTIGHVAFHLPSEDLLFSADSLMALGCGRLFEGDPAMMWASLAPLRALPPQTRIASGHEYTATNARFCLDLDPDNSALRRRADQVFAARERGAPTVPSLLSDELATNPFLRADDPDLAAVLGRADADPVEIFALIRAKRDKWR